MRCGQLDDAHVRLPVTLVALSIVLATSACSSGGPGDTPQTSGVASSKRLIDLTSAEKGMVCDWMVGRAGSYGVPGACDRSKPAPEYPFLAYDDQADCVQDSPDQTFSDCGATVAQLEACVSRLPACATLIDVSEVSACAALEGC
jgi:hypothetical protein